MLLGIHNIEPIRKKLQLFAFSIFFTSISFAQEYPKLLDSLKLSGSTTIYSLKQNKWFFTDKQDAYRATLAASTFKILNSLISLEEKVIKNEHEILNWDGKEKMFLGTRVEAWNKPTDLCNAYKNSTVWFYIELAKRIGKEKYKKYLKKCKYGNKNLSGKLADFWNHGALEISPVNQIEFLTKLYNNKLPFSREVMQTVKKIMVSQKSKEYVIRSKTGWTQKDKKDIGWWIGFMETKKNVYFFATRLEKNINTKNTNFLKARKEITFKALNKIRITERSP